MVQLSNNASSRIFRVLEQSCLTLSPKVTHFNPSLFLKVADRQLWHDYVGLRTTVTSSDSGDTILRTDMRHEYPWSEITVPHVVCFAADDTWAYSSAWLIVTIFWMPIVLKCLSHSVIMEKIKIFKINNIQNKMSLTSSATYSGQETWAVQLSLMLNFDMT